MHLYWQNIHQKIDQSKLRKIKRTRACEIYTCMKYIEQIGGPRRISQGTRKACIKYMKNIYVKYMSNILCMKYMEQIVGPRHISWGTRKACVKSNITWWPILLHLYGPPHFQGVSHKIWLKSDEIWIWNVSFNQNPLNWCNLLIQVWCNTLWRNMADFILLGLSRPGFNQNVFQS